MNRHKHKRTYIDWCWFFGANIWDGSRWLERQGRRYIQVRRIH